MEFGEITFAIQRQHRMMPGAAMVVDTLIAAAQEGAQIRARGWRAGGRDHDNIALAMERNESLTAERMAFHQAQMDRQRFGYAADDADRRAAAIGGDVDLSQIAATAAHALVDRARVTARRDDVAIGRESISRQWLRSQDKTIIGCHAARYG